MIADRDGSHPQEVGRCEHGDGHGGGGQIWIDNQTIAYRMNEVYKPHTRTMVRQLDDASELQFAGNLRNFSLANGTGIVETDGIQVSLWRHATGQLTPFLDTQQLVTVIPESLRYGDRSNDSMQNAKWSADGRFLSMVLINRLSPPGEVPWSFKSILVMNADGHQPRYLGEILHHPLWFYDSKTICGWQKNEQGNQDLTLFSCHGDLPRVLLTNTKGHHPHPHPNGRHIAIDVHDQPNKGQSQLLLYDLKDATSQLLATFEHPDNSYRSGFHIHPVWSRDGRRLYCNAYEKGQPGMYAIDL